jgi:hypothetical protein
MWLFVTVSCRTRSVQDLLYLQCPRECPSIRASGPHQRLYDQEWRQPGGSVSPEEEVKPKQTGQTLLENWQRKSDACFCYDCLLPVHISADLLPTRGRPPPYASSSSGLPQRTKLFFRSMTLALQYMPGTGLTAWNSAGTTRIFCLS